MFSHVYNPLLHDSVFWRLLKYNVFENIMKMERFLLWSNCSILNNIFKSI